MRRSDGGTEIGRRPLLHRLRVFTQGPAKAGPYVCAARFSGNAGQDPCIALLGLSLACTPPGSGGEAIGISLHTTPGGTLPASIVITGLSSTELGGLRNARLGESDWESLLRVAVADAAGESLPAVKGTYAVTSEAVTFTSLFPFDPGRSYHVSFDAARLPRPRRATLVTTTVGLPALSTRPSTSVTAVHPSEDVVPENLLRMYVEFSAPMGSSSAHDFVRLVDRTGPTEEVVEGAFLPVEADFWSPDHKRYTLFLDPGRVKRDILPNRQSGRPLRAGRRYVLEIGSAWTDANRQPLTTTYRHEFRAGPVVESAIRLADWKIAPPTSGTRDPLIVTFPRSLDHAVVMRALGVEGTGQRAMAGASSIEAHDTRWTFVPSEPWTPGPYQLAALSFLEDPQGNQIDRPFEEAVDRPTPERTPESFRLAFHVSASRTR